MARRHIMESTFRLNLLNPQHAKINEVIKGLNPKIYKSKNQFLIEACEFYIDHYGEDDIPSKEEKRYEQFVTRDEIEQIKKEIEYSAMTEARKEVIMTKVMSILLHSQWYGLLWQIYLELMMLIQRRKNCVIQRLILSLHMNIMKD